jgi:ketosteroid isomerase-like protein
VRATGVEFDVPEVHIWTIRDGKVAAANFYIDTPLMLEALDTGG